MGVRQATAKNLATLTIEEDAHWTDFFEDSLNDGLTERQADLRAWEYMQQEFPRLQAFDGCEA